MNETVAPPPATADAETAVGGVGSLALAPGWDSGPIGIAMTSGRR